MSGTTLQSHEKSSWCTEDNHHVVHITASAIHKSPVPNPYCGLTTVTCDVEQTLKLEIRFWAYGQEEAVILKIESEPSNCSLAASFQAQIQQKFWVIPNTPQRTHRSKLASKLQPCNLILRSPDFLKNLVCKKFFWMLYSLWSLE